MTNKTLNYGALLFFVVIIIGLLFNYFTAKNYDTSNQAVVKQFEDNEFMLDYYKLNLLVNMENHGNYRFFDLRPEADFRIDHLPGAINIPFEILLKSHNLRNIKNHSKTHTPVLYASEEAMAQTARMLLLGKGHENIMVMSGNFETAQKYVIENFRPEKAFYRDEKARFDYPRFMQTTKAPKESRADDKNQIIPEVKTETITVEGGC